MLYDLIIDLYNMCCVLGLFVNMFFSYDSYEWFVGLFYINWLIMLVKFVNCVFKGSFIEIICSLFKR